MGCFVIRDHAPEGVTDRLYVHLEAGSEVKKQLKIEEQEIDRSKEVIYNEEAV